MNSNKVNKPTWSNQTSSSTNNQKVVVLSPDLLQQLGINLEKVQNSEEVSFEKDSLKEHCNEVSSCPSKAFNDDKLYKSASNLETENLIKNSVVSSTFNTMRSEVNSNETLVSANKQEDSVEVQLEKMKDIDVNYENYAQNIDLGSSTNKIPVDCIILKEDVSNLNTGNQTQESIILPTEKLLKNSQNSDLYHKADKCSNNIKIISQEVIGFDRPMQLLHQTKSDPRDSNVDTVIESNKISERKEQKQCILSNVSNDILVCDSGQNELKPSNKHFGLRDKFDKLEKMHYVKENSNKTEMSKAYKGQKYKSVPLSTESSSKYDTQLGSDLYKNKTNSSEKYLATSKLCIQGVEKPGGNETMLYKNVKDKNIRTYYRSQKQKSKTTSRITMQTLKNDLLIENIEYLIDVKPDLTIEQNMCTCVDFGSFSYYDSYGKNYEHVHFWPRKPVCSFEDLYNIYEDNIKIQIKESIEDQNLIDNIYDGGSICSNKLENEHKNVNFDILFPKSKVVHHKQFTRKRSAISENVESANKFLQVGNEEYIANKMIKFDDKSRSDTTLDMFSNKSIFFDTKAASNIEEENQPTETKKNEKEYLSDKAKRRKRSQTVSESDKHNTKRGRSIDRVTCGVCKVKVISTDWSDHVSSEHDFIAWPEGKKNFNFDDKTLLKNLEQRLCETRKIICTFCDKELVDVYEFIDHVKICNYWRFTRNHSVVCGVCNKEVEKNMWIEHICKQHNYLAWELGEEPLDLTDAKKVRSFLKITNQAIGGLECSNCGIKRKFVKSFIDHLKKCVNIDVLSSNREAEFNETESLQSSNNVAAETSDSIEKSTSRKNDNNDESVVTDNTDDSSASYTCGVCLAPVESAQWTAHIRMAHGYVAWKEGDRAINVDDEKEVHDHLYAVNKLVNGLHCPKCNIRRKYVKSFLNHIKECDESNPLNSAINETVNESSTSELNVDLSESKAESINEEETIECGVCHQQMQGVFWLRHIQEDHQYIAWKEGAKPINVDDESEVHEYLYKISKCLEGLICSKCGLRRKYAKLFLNHIKDCDGSKQLDTTINESCTSDLNVDLSESKAESINEEETIECGVCHQQMQGVFWLRHIQKDHQYIAWKEGAKPINVDDESEVHEHLYKLSKCLEGFICSKCGLRRKYAKSFLNHIKDCDGSKQLDTTINESCTSELNVDLSESKAESINEEETIECGVCHQQMQGVFWLRHIQEDHQYIAWKEGAKPINVDDESEVHEHLYNLSKCQEGLICSKCGLRRKYVKSYLNHIKDCDGSNIHDNGNDSLPSDLNVTDHNLNDSGLDDKDDEDTIECGVCHEQMLGKQWVSHIQLQHHYLAWKEGRRPIDLNDTQQVTDYLYTLSKRLEGLTCAKCGTCRKYVKSFLSHIRTCDESIKLDSTLNETINNSFIPDLSSKKPVADTGKDDLKTIECGVCHQQMLGKHWLQHIQKGHSYLAWREGERPIDFNVEENVHNHLYEMCKQYDGLICSKCGLLRKYVKVFLSHIQSCDATLVVEFPEAEEKLDEDVSKCGVCGDFVEKNAWRSHSMLRHYNLAWRVGEYPIDARNPYIVEKYLKEYRNKFKKFVCSLCGLARASAMGFYAHILQCGKSEQEVESYKIYCDICDSKYLCIYKNQHAAMHRDQELARERKLGLEESKLKAKKEDEVVPGEGRMAARKARNVIEKYKSCEFKCSTCGYGADEEKEMEEHSCRKIICNDPSDSEHAVKEDSSTEDEDTGVDSNISDVETKHDKKRKHGESIPKIKRIPFEVPNPKTYIQTAKKEYFETYMSKAMLYPKWRECAYDKVPESEVAEYMPPLEESCNVRLSKGDWTKFKKFEVKKIHGIEALFVGSSIRSVSWCGDGRHVAVAALAAADTPRLPAARTHAARNLLQLWDCPPGPPGAACRPGRSSRPSRPGPGPGHGSTAKFALGIAHDYGIVWAMDWCPSGTTDELEVNQTTVARIGLLAIACSNGLAYILSVPHPSTIALDDNKVCKLRPVAELRLERSEQKFHATSICWSPLSGHSVVIVGYSDGTTASYDLQSESPLLAERRGDIDIFYPFHDEKSHNTCVTGVTIFPLGLSKSEVVSSASPTGAGAVRRAAAPVRLATHLASSAALHPPHWPSVLLAENDSIVNQAVNELDWWCVGRRLGAMNSGGGCLHCGHFAAFSPPALKLMKPHPVYCELYKETIAIIQMVSLDKNPSKQKNDDYSVKLEPLTYDDAVKSYGVEVKFAKDLDKKQLQSLCNNEQCPERFPLSDIPALAFNPAAERHRQLALATHSGFVFILTV